MEFFTWHWEGVPNIFLELLSQILGQAIGCGATGADSGPERGWFCVDLQEPIPSRRSRTLWPQLVNDLEKDDVLRRRAFFHSTASVGFLGNLI
jgi:hypothetical protein